MQGAPEDLHVRALMIFGAGSLWGSNGGTRATKFAVRPSRPVDRTFDGGARLRRTHLENPSSVSRSGGVAGVVEFGDIGGEGRIIERARRRATRRGGRATLA